MSLAFPLSALLFGAVVSGLGAPLVVRLKLAPAERLVATAALSLLCVFFIGWIRFLLGPVGQATWLLPLLAVVGLIAARRELKNWWRDAEARALLFGQFIVSLWCVGWAATIVSYSGGGWAGDWFEHWERTRFFLEHWSTDHMFLGIYPLTARPPLVNVATAELLLPGVSNYAHYQFVMVLLSTLAFLPAALLARRFGGGAAIPLVAALFMVNPLFVQNATFPWTKLPAAFFTLTSLAFFLRSQDDGAPRSTAWLAAGCLAGGLLAHYSAGPYAVAIAAGWLWFGRARWREPEWRRTLLVAVAAGAGVLTLWFGWALLRLGAAGTFLTNTSVTTVDAHAGNQLLKILLNFRDTLVPHFLRSPDDPLITQRSLWGGWRDWWFQSYQLNLLLAFGSTAWLVLSCALWQHAGQAARAARQFWGGFIVLVIFLGVATHGARDQWGLVHICLQSLVLLGLVYVASRWAHLSRTLRRVLIAGAVCDFVFGILLQFGVQNYAFDRWFAAGRSPDDTLRSYNQPAFMNLAGKLNNHVQFVADTWPPLLAPALLLLAAGLAVAFLRSRRPGAT